MTAPITNFTPLIDRHCRAARRALADGLAALAPQLTAAEAALIATHAAAALGHTARMKLNRVLLLELHAAKRAGELGAAGEAERYGQFVAAADSEAFDAHLDRRYPPLRPRLQQALDQQQRAIVTLAARLAADRDALSALLGRPAGALVDISVGMGDLHAGGQSVAKLEFEGGQVLYKPRALRIDRQFDALLSQLFGDNPQRIRVPGVIDRGNYGWAEFIPHRYCSDETELRRFYRGLGEWLGVLRLVGGVDIHRENLIACGPVPIVIDVESLFALQPVEQVSGNGQAYDLAARLVFTSVLRTGIVPYRDSSVGFDGVDVSAAGALPGQQPKAHVPVIANDGTTDARLQMIDMERDAAQNHPSEQPDVSRYWDHLSEGFLAVSEQLRALDARGELEPLLYAFDGTLVRDIRRATQVYVEIARMLWHPASLHDQAAAVARARDLLLRHAASTRQAPSGEDEIRAEIAAMLTGDVPIFVARLDHGRIAPSLADWRAMRIDLEELTIRCALVATSLNRGSGENERDGRHYFARQPHADKLEVRRRKLATVAVQRLLGLAVRGDDGTVTWVTPETIGGNWLVQPVQNDTYFGLGGVLVALAGYRAEVHAGRADPVDGLDASLRGAIAVLRALDTNQPSPRAGGYNGLGASIWTWLTLHDLLGEPELLQLAIGAAAALERLDIRTDKALDLIDGCSGAIVPLLHLHAATADRRWLDLAAAAGRHLQAHALCDEHGACWRTPAFEEPVGGFAHGAAGIAWALERLALSEAGDAAERARWLDLAQQGFAFQDSLYDASRNNWVDRRQLDANTTFHTWCNGSVGIGFAAADLYQRTGSPDHRQRLRRAVQASRGFWGISHTLCHGDLSLADLMIRASQLDPQVCANDSLETVAEVVSSIEEHRGFVGSLTRAAFTPGLMTGLSGAVHGLNRLHPESRLPSPLLQERMVLTG